MPDVHILTSAINKADYAYRLCNNIILDMTEENKEL